MHLESGTWLIPMCDPSGLSVGGCTMLPEASRTERPSAQQTRCGPCPAISGGSRPQGPSPQAPELICTPTFLAQALPFGATY